MVTQQDVHHLDGSYPSDHAIPANVQAWGRIGRSNSNAIIFLVAKANFPRFCLVLWFKARPL